MLLSSLSRPPHTPPPAPFIHVQNVNISRAMNEWQTGEAPSLLNTASLANKFYWETDDSSKALGKVNLCAGVLHRSPLLSQQKSLFLAWHEPPSHGVISAAGSGTQMVLHTCQLPNIQKVMC